MFYNILLKLKKEFQVKNNKKFKIKVMKNSAIYNKKIRSQLLNLLSSFIKKTIKKKVFGSFYNSNTILKVDQYF